MAFRQSCLSRHRRPKTNLSSRKKSPLKTLPNLYTIWSDSLGKCLHKNTNFNAFLYHIPPQMNKFPSNFLIFFNRHSRHPIPYFVQLARFCGSSIALTKEFYRPSFSTAIRRALDVLLVVFIFCLVVVLVDAGCAALQQFYPTTWFFFSSSFFLSSYFSIGIYLLRCARSL